MTNPIEVEMSEDDFEDYLNEIYEPVTICGFEHDQGTLLRRIDPVAFRCGIAEMELKYECSECRDEYDNYDSANECCTDELEEDQEDDE